MVGSKIIPYEDYNFNKFYNILNKKLLKNNESYNFENIKIYFPINFSNHWSLIEVTFEKQEINYFDSVFDFNRFKIVTNVFVKFMEDVCRHKMIAGYKEWKVINVNTPNQNNTSDCGVFMCKNIDFLIRQQKLNFSYLDIPYFRMLIGIEIINNKLINNSK